MIYCRGDMKSRGSSLYIIIVLLVILGNTPISSGNTRTKSPSNMEILAAPDGSNLFYTIQWDYPGVGEVDVPFGFEDIVRITFKFGWALSYDRPDVSIFWSPDNLTNWQSKPTTYLYESQPYWYYEVYFGGFEQGQDVYFYLGCNLTTEGWIGLGFRQSWTLHFKVNEDDFYGMNYLPNSGYNVRWGDPNALKVSFRVFHNGWQISQPSLTLYTSPTNSTPWTPWDCERVSQSSYFYYFESILGGFERGQEMYFYISGSGFYSFHYNFTCSSGPLMMNPRIVPDTIWPETAFDIVCNISDDDYGMTLYDPAVGYRVNGGSWNYVDMTLLANTTNSVHVEAQGICDFEYVCAAVNDNDEMSCSDILFRRIDKLGDYLTLYLSDYDIDRGQTILVTGHLSPIINRTIFLQYSFDESTWVNITTFYPDDEGDYRYYWKPTRGGDYYVRSIMIGDIHHKTLISIVRSLDVSGPTTTSPITTSILPVSTSTETSQPTTGPTTESISTAISTSTTSISSSPSLVPPFDSTMLYLSAGAGIVIIIIAAIMVKRR